MFVGQVGQDVDVEAPADTTLFLVLELTSQERHVFGIEAEVGTEVVIDLSDTLRPLRVIGVDVAIASPLDYSVGATLRDSLPTESLFCLYSLQK